MNFRTLLTRLSSFANPTRTPTHSRSYCTNTTRKTKTSSYTISSPLGNPETRLVPQLDEWVQKGKKVSESIRTHRPFTRSNSSFFLCSGNALQAEVSSFREERFLVDAGLGTPRICMQDEPTGLPINRATRFENKVEFLDQVTGESLIKKRLLERFFIDLVAGESLFKDRAAAKFNALVGSTDVVAGEPLLLLPRRFRQNRAWMELNKIWRTNTRVKGFIIEKVKGGYSVAIAGFLAFLPLRRFRRRKRISRRKGISNDRFTIESINPKRMNIVVF